MGVVVVVVVAVAGFFFFFFFFFLGGGGGGGLGTQAVKSSQFVPTERLRNPKGKTALPMLPTPTNSAELCIAMKLSC